MVLYKIVNSFDKDPDFKELIGGVGIIGKTPVIHILFISIRVVTERAGNIITLPA